MKQNHSVTPPAHSSFDRWVGRVTDIDDETLTVAVRPRSRPTASPVTRKLLSTDYASTRPAHIGMHVVVDERKDGSMRAYRRTRWYEGVFFDAGDIALAIVVGIAAIFD